MIGALVSADYDGWWELEAFSDDGRFSDAFPDSWWAMAHEELLARGKRAVEDSYDAALTLSDTREAGAT